MTEPILIIVAAVAVLGFAARIAWVRAHIDRADEFAEADKAARMIPDEVYSAVITGEIPAFSYERLYRTSDGHGTMMTEQRPTGVLQPLPEPELALDEYITGKAVRIIRRAEEERLEWHFDQLTGSWQPPTDLTHSLDFDNWLRALLEDREEVAA